MSKNFINPIGEAFSFRLQPLQFEALLRHRLTEDEPFAQVINRQLRRLKIAISARRVPKEPTGEELGGAKNISVGLDLNPVEPFVIKFQTRKNISTPQIALRHLVVWSNDLPLKECFSSAQEFYEAMLSGYKAGDTILIRSVIASAIDRCTIEQAKAWVWSLAQDGRLKLRVPAASLHDRTTINLPRNGGNLYAIIEVV